MTVERKEALPLNAIRAFVMIARESNLTRAARVLGITQSAVSRHLAVLESYLGAKLIERRGRNTTLTDFGRRFADAVGEPLDAIAFTVQHMRRSQVGANRLVVRTSLSTFAYSTLIPNLRDFTRDTEGAVVEVVTSLAPPSTTDRFDVLVTRDLEISEPSDRWDLFEEHLICAGAPALVSGRTLSSIHEAPFLAITSRPDILPRWLSAMDIAKSAIKIAAHYDHHYLALPAVTTGQGLLVAPEIVIADVVRQGILAFVPDSRTPSGMHYRAYAVDRSSDPDLSRAFCRWLLRLCRRAALSDLEKPSD
ncbi:MAG: LysR family transcriptional regulator [Kiloniellales bacterium]|nr:LysR family transcriptional regulator [Kiloniellales bacterium]